MTYDVRIAFVSQDSNVSDAILSTLVAGLEQLGYRGPRLERNYSFPDWFGKQYADGAHQLCGVPGFL